MNEHMKKLILIPIFLCFVCMINAQIVKIQPKFEVGEEKYFLGSTKLKGGDTDYTLLFLQRIKVLSADKNGFTMEAEIIKIDLEYDHRTYETDLAGTILKARKNNIYKFKTNVDGVITSLLNADEVMKKGKETLGDEWDVRFWAEYPDKFSNATAQLALDNIVFSGLTEEGFISWMSGAPFPFHLNGKEFGSERRYHYEAKDGLKMLRTVELLSFDVNHNLKIGIKDKLDMTQEERKQFLLNQLKKDFPNQTDKINIDELFKESGLKNYKKDLSFDYELDSSFWPTKYEIIDADGDLLIRYKFWMLSDEQIRNFLGK